MKTKPLHGSRGRPPKQKSFKSEMENTEGLAEAGPQNAKPSVEILSCISYQKFRYSGENRPGKKYQEKDFMELKLSNLSDKVVRVVIICTDAENKELIHPNGLVGRDCHDGIYDKEYAITRQSHTIKIPYLRTERIKTKKNEHEKILNILKGRAGHLPSPYRERCESQCTNQYTFNRKFDTTKVCLGVIVTVRSHFQGAVNGSLHAISHVVNNASEKTSLGILKLSNSLIPASKGGCIDVFTTEDGPAIENDKYVLYVTVESEEGIEWQSESFSPSKGDILYKRIISYKVPPFVHDPDITHDVHAILHLECPQSNQICEHPILYSLHGEEFVYYDTQNLKRSYSEELDDVKPPKRLKLEDRQNSDVVKAVLKESLKKKREDDRRNSLAPTVQIIQSSEEGALVRRTESHSVEEDMNHVALHQYGPEELKVLASAYSHDVPSNTVLIITNDGPDDIENAINKGVSYFDERAIKGGGNKHQVIYIDSSHQETTVESSPVEGNQVIILPEARSSDNIENKTKDQSSEPTSLREQYLIINDDSRVVPVSAVPSKRIATSVPEKKSRKTDSPWAVPSDDESNYDNIFSDLTFDKQPKVVKKPFNNHRNGIPQNAFPNESADSLPVERPKTITILSSKGDSNSITVTNRDIANSLKSLSRAGNPNLDFSRVNLPSDIGINLNSEIIASFDLVKEIDKNTE